MLPVHDMPIRAQLKFAALVPATGLSAANASGRGCGHSTFPAASTGQQRIRGE